jgi:GNAT superfamily N-acetyltransferase
MCAALLARGELALAVLDHDADVYVGWLAWERARDDRPVALHYAFTKSAYRREGVATRLLRYVAGSGPTEHSSEPRQRWARQWIARVGSAHNPYRAVCV